MRDQAGWPEPTVGTSQGTFPRGAILIFSGVVLSLTTGLFNRRRAHRELPMDDVAPVAAAG